MMKEGKGELIHQSGIMYFIKINGVFNKKKTKLKSNRIPFDLEEGLGGKEVEVSYEKDGNRILVKQIRLGDKKFGDINYKPQHKKSHKSKNSKTRSKSQKSYSHGDSVKFSKTPYNFIPLNKEILTSEVHKKENNKVSLKEEHKQNIFHRDKLSGTIQISINNESPLFIGSHKVKLDEDNGFYRIKPFSINGKPAIPGSSIRGMLYSLYELATHSPMVNMEDKPVYFRSTLPDFKDKEDCDLRFGVLSTNNSGFIIYDLHDNVEKLNHWDYKSPLTLIDDSDYLGISSGKIMGKVFSFGVSKRELNHNIKPKFSGEEVNSIVEDYKSDANRDDEIDKKLNIIKLARNHYIKEIRGYGCPIWYSTKKGNITSVGHAKYHRIPAENRSVDMLPKKHQDAFKERHSKKKYVDEPYELSSAEILFGTSETHASKVRFTDATSGNASFQEEAKLLKPLLSPKIKSANLYLKAGNGKPGWQKDKDQELRGTKSYYDKSGDYTWYDDIETNDHKKRGQQKNLQSLIKPIEKGAEFHTSIHFNNLTKVELGGLLFILQLKDKLRHSIGMGKPYGLGRVKISIESLDIIDQKKRYTPSHSIGDDNLKNVEIEELIEKFEKEILEQISKSNTDSLWELDRFKNLEGLMKMRSSDDKKSEYMDGFKPHENKNPLIDDPENLSDYDLVSRDQYLKK